ncbi:hypothetical protein L596_021872 [Steinernema carpocapsae]|uniref:AB hydrolase-1 domain-containing protein n=1 Tax=Steinernema carpocapsae TaxID=34508 RepID=A0A4U5MKE4_STECR|nr:hypothetical protein L596_021872 [Steinernema carpocapsae]
MQEQESDVDQPSTEIHPHQGRNGACGKCCLLCKLAGLLCCIFCPPAPELIARKLAFHPIAKGTTYRLMGAATNGAFELKSAKHARKMATEIWIEVPKREEQGAMENYAWIREALVFTVKTKRGNHLVGIWKEASHFSMGKKKRPNLVILFAQPNSSDLGCFLQPGAPSISLQHMSIAYEADVVAFDYSGFGFSSGAASEKNIYADIEAVFEFIREKRGENVEIVLLGFSMGTAASIHLAAKNPANLHGVVLLAPFASGLRLFLNKPARSEPYFFDRFLSFEKVPEIQAPTLIVHGHQDAIVPLKHGKTLHSRLRNPAPPLFVATGDHANILNTTNALIVHRICSFLYSEAIPEVSEE